MEETERDEFLVEFLGLMKSRGVSPEITYRQDHKVDSYTPRPAPSYDRTAVTGWVTSSTQDLDSAPRARGILVSVDGTLWNYEALTIPYDRILARSLYFREHYFGPDIFILLGDDRTNSHQLTSESLAESAAACMALTS